MSHKFSLIISPYFLVALGFGCLSSPDRNNALDPNSDNPLTTGTISGRVANYYAPFTRPLSGVNISLLSTSLSVTTDMQGRFEFQNVAAGAYELLATKPGYAPDTSAVMVAVSQPAEIDMHLDALPQFTSISAATRHIKRVFPSEDQYLLEITAEVEDLDGNDIDFIEVDIPGFAFRDTFDLSPVPGTYVKILEERVLPVNSLHDLTGTPIRLVAHDLPGYSNISEPVFVSRIIDQSPVIVSPQSFALVTAMPELQWGEVDLPFSFTFRAEVLRTDLGVQVAAWGQSGITGDVTSTVVTESLAAGSYVWSVSIIDDFGNSSKSLEGSFRIN